MDRIELKPCPFCGEKENLRVSRSHRSLIDYWYVWCLKCEATNGKHSSKAKAIEFWNRRAGDE